MGITAKPIGKMQSIMRKIKNRNEAEARTIRHTLDKSTKKKENTEEQ